MTILVDFRMKQSGQLGLNMSTWSRIGQHRKSIQTLGSTAEITDENNLAAHEAEHYIRVIHWNAWTSRRIHRFPKDKLSKNKFQYD